MIGGRPSKDWNNYWRLIRPTWDVDALPPLIHGLRRRHRPLIVLLCHFWAFFERFRANLSNFKRHLSDFGRQMQLVGTTSSITSLSIDSIFASPGPAPSQPSKDWNNYWRLISPLRIGGIDWIFLQGLKWDYYHLIQRAEKPPNPLSLRWLIMRGS